MENINEDVKRFLQKTYSSDDGYGYGDGSGYGSCSVYGYGYGSGSGDGSSSGDGIISFCGHNVVVIDGINTVIEKAKGNLGKGFIIKGDLTTEKCYIAKIGSLFAHGKTIGEARRDLAKKVFMSMDIDEKIDMFLSEFKIGVKYPAIKFYEWHHILTGSCKMGRDTFVKEHGIDIEKDMFTVSEFVHLTKSEYGKEVISELTERIYSE